MICFQDVHRVPRRVPVGSKCAVQPVERPVEAAHLNLLAPSQILFTESAAKSFSPHHHCQAHHTSNRAEHRDTQEPLRPPNGPEVRGNEKSSSDEGSSDENACAPENANVIKTSDKPQRWTFLSISTLVLSIYSTALSGLWLVVAIVQPHWGSVISSTGSLNPSTANLVTALLAKTIEITFVTVFISFLGQVLTRRSLQPNTNGVNLSEITMRSWVVQPGSLITHCKTLSSAGFTVLGAATILAAVTSMFFTTASEAMVAPKLKFGSEESRSLSGYVRSSYANKRYITQNCQVLQADDDDHASETCLFLKLQLESYQDLLAFSKNWEGQEHGQNLKERPTVSRLLGNTTLEPSWIDTEFSDVAGQHEDKKRIINNVTLAWPHPGVATAATSQMNGILQPADLGGIGRYIVKARVVSPVVNALCVEMNEDDLAPIVYTSWPDARHDKTGVGNQTVGVFDWIEDVPAYTYGENNEEWLNATVVDDIFRWGHKYRRRPPVFSYYPEDNNMLVNTSVYAGDAVYLLGKSPESENYTLCELRSWITPQCYTQYQASGASGPSMQVVCSNDPDLPTYQNAWPADTAWPGAAIDWTWVTDAWRLSRLSSFTLHANASDTSLLMQLALYNAALPRTLPSLAEAAVVYVSTLVLNGALDTSFYHYFDYDAEGNILDAPGTLETFNATIQTHKYTSGHVDQWHRLFYVILGLAFAINLFCLATCVMRRGLVTDITEPQNTFMVALNGPPSERFKGSFETGLRSDQLAVPWRVVPTSEGKDYKIEEVRIEEGG